MTEPLLPDAAPAEGGRRTVIVAGLILAVLIGASLTILSVRRDRSADKETTTRTASAATGPLVRTARAGAGAATEDVVVQGEVEPWASVTLYAKVSGYLTRIEVDKGDDVHRGEVLADIESPETDQAYVAAKADADAKHELAQRDRELLAKKFVAAEEVETADAAAQMSAARLEALNTERGYEHLVAPFDGTVTARFADQGALVQAATTNQTSALPVVTIADVSHLRVRIYLNQEQAGAARRGTPAIITLSERPGFSEAARISRLTEELDPKTRTLLAELDVGNSKHELLAGSFVNVHLTLPMTAAVSVPAEALVLRGEKPLVAIVDSTNHVRFVPVVTGESDGKVVSILSGVHAGERIAINLGRGITDGALVRPDSTGSQP